jgi:adenylate cyclase
MRHAYQVNEISIKALNQISRISSGNPLFVEEMTRHWLETGALDIEQDHHGKKNLMLRESSVSVPSTIQSLIASRMERLNPYAREALRWAAEFE